MKLRQSQRRTCDPEQICCVIAEIFLNYFWRITDELDECLFLLEINKKVKVNKGYNTIDKTRL